MTGSKTPITIYTKLHFSKKSTSNQLFLLIPDKPLAKFTINNTYHSLHNITVTGNESCYTES